MAESNKIHMPGSFGGLMRYDEEYKSKFMFSPHQVIAFIVAIIVLIIILKLLFPTPTSGTSVVPGASLIFSSLSPKRKL